MFRVLLILIVVGPVALAQQAQPQSTTDDVVRINTELVQTGVTVFDKQGRFVDGLKKENFELQVDGRSVSISFFENIVAGTQRDRVASMRGKDQAALATNPGFALSFRQRTIIFFVDDRHLSLAHMGRQEEACSQYCKRFSFVV